MSRNNHPEITVSKILDAAYELFMTKGYDETTVQDIVVAIGLSKGAIYHHFASKEEISDALWHRFLNVDLVIGISEETELTGYQRLKKLLLTALSMDDIFSPKLMSAVIARNPRFLVKLLNCVYNEVTPAITRIFEDGTRDRSLRAHNYKMLSESISVLIFFWVVPTMNPCSLEDYLEKIRYIKTFFEQQGIRIIDDTIFSAAEKHYKSSIAD